MAILRTNGFVQLRRGLQEHVADGSMTIYEAWIFISILFNADPKTGIWIGSAAALAKLFPINTRYCQRALARLESKAYLKRFQSPGRNGCFPIAIHNFECTDGSLRGKRLNALDSKASDSLIYSSVAEMSEVGTEVGTGVGTQVGTPLYRNGEQRREKREEKTLAPSSPELNGAGAPPIGTISCVGKGPKVWPIYQAKVDEWQETYPGIDVIAELRKIRQWAIDNRKKRKTFDGMPRFINSWLSKSQNQVGGNGNGTVNAGRLSTADERNRKRDGVIKEFLGEGDEEADGPGGESLPFSKL